jgi:hypothetical protein
LKDQPVRFLFDGGDDELNDVAGFVFEFDWQILGTQHGSGVLERLEEFPGGDTVIQIVADPRLEKACNQAAHGAAAIDKVLLHAADFGDVEMRLNRFAIGPHHRER